jgi:predicted acylesterase/phospholipase RssA
MEILIGVPLFLQPLFEWFGTWLSCIQQGWFQGTSVLSSWYEQIWTLPRNAYLPILAVLLVFWPIMLSLAIAIATASTWIFWLTTSMVFGSVQLVYVSYQFLMIACDIFGLSVLKTYSIIRRQILHYLDWSGSHIMNMHNPIRASRRRLWMREVDSAGTYENFLKIRLAAKDVTKTEAYVNKAAAAKKSKTDGALPPLLRSNSMTEVHDDDAVANLPRNRSFSVTAQEKKMNGALTSALASSAAVTDPLVQEELGEMTTELLVTTSSRLLEARQMAEQEQENNEANANNDDDANATKKTKHPSHSNSSAASALKYLLSAVVKRNHLNLDDLLIGNARSIAESGRYGLSSKSRQLIRSYYEEVEKGLDWIADAPIIQDDTNSNSNNPNTIEPETNVDGFPMYQHPPSRHKEITDRIMLIRKMKQNMGRTALMLSGGGAQAMYHLGVIRALIQSKGYNDIKVISGTSGGSIAAAMCAIKTSSELYADVCVPLVSTDYGLNGRMKKENIRWFPSITDMAQYWMKHKLLVDSKEFRRTCEFYYADITFDEAFERTGKHVCITVSASRASGDTAQRLLLNHISTPHVTIASAVAASCALPGVMAPAKLLAKNSSGVLEPFEVDGVEWIDGSVQADLPFQRIATLFAVTSFLVSQTNFHVVPFLNKAHHPKQQSLYWRLFQTMEWDIRNRALKLSHLGLFPRIFGQDISKVFKQKYHGNLTIVPRFTAMQTVGLKALSNPNVVDMEGYLKYGQIATWPYLNVIRDMIRLEKSLDDCLTRLEDRARALQPDSDWSNHDDVESIASSSYMALGSANRVRIIGRPPSAIRERDSERVRQKVGNLEHENLELRKQVEELQQLLAKNNSGSGAPKDSKRKEAHEADQDPGHPLLSAGSEGAVWNLVLRSTSENSS